MYAVTMNGVKTEIKVGDDIFRLYTCMCQFTQLLIRYYSEPVVRYSLVKFTNRWRQKGRKFSTMQNKRKNLVQFVVNEIFIVFCKQLKKGSFLDTNLL